MTHCGAADHEWERIQWHTGHGESTARPVGDNLLPVDGGPYGLEGFEFAMCLRCGALRLVRFVHNRTTTAIYYPDAPESV